MLRFLQLVPILLLTVLKISLSMTRYGVPCWDGCKKRDGSGYYTCTTIEVYESKTSLGKSGYCSPSCGKTYKGVPCNDDCLTRGSKYYWCNVGDSWDYCSRNSCPVQIPQGYEDCSSEFIGKTVWFEYLYYKGYWLAKGYKNEYAALWNPGNHEDLFCPDEGYGWDISKSKDGNSVNIKTIRPGYRDLYFIGVRNYEKIVASNGRVRHSKKTSNMASAIDDSNLSELFDFRIICKDCGSTNNCTLLRAYDESKLYTNQGKNLEMCKNCGSDDWFTWRVY